MLDVDIEVRILKTGRRAVFAMTDFMPGDVIFTLDASTTFTDEAYARLTPEQRSFTVWYEDAWTFMPEPMCYVQHASNPNAGSRRGVVIAIKEIHIGEEITISVFRKADSVV